jgi:hypothetical protein
MLNGVRHSWHVGFITEIADVDVEGGASLVSLRVMDEKSLEVIVQTDNSIVPVVKGRLLEMIGQKDNGRSLAPRRRVQVLRGWHRGKVFLLRWEGEGEG